MEFQAERTVSRMPYRDEHLLFDFESGSAWLDSRHIVMTRKESELLAMLVEHAGEIVPRDVLLLDIWGYGRQIRTRTLDVHIRYLRRKLGAYAGRYIETVFGVGYRFQRFYEPRHAGEFLPSFVAATA